MTQTTLEPASDPEAQRDTVPWENFLADRIGLPPIATGLLVAGTLFGAFVALQWAIGLPLWSDDPQSGPGFVRSARLTFFVTALIGYSLAANLYLPRAIYRDQVASLIDEPERRRALLEFDPLVLSLHVVRRSRLAGLAGIVVALVVIALTAPASLAALDPAYLPVSVLTPLLFWILARSTACAFCGRSVSTAPASVSSPCTRWGRRC
jgi:hypothetical protein